MRHPGLQSAIRLEQISRSMADFGSTLRDAIRRKRELLIEVACLEKKEKAIRIKLDELVAVQNSILKCEQLNEFGLPPDMSNEHFENFTKQKITS